MIRRKKIIYGIALAAVSILFAAGFLELYLRLILFHDFKLGDGLLKHENLYADYFSDDDFWKLNYLLNNDYEESEGRHPLLGWIGEFDPVTYEHNDRDHVGARTPVLLYGDSFAACGTPVCSQDILNGDEDFSKQFYLLNYGVGGYGLDQIELLYKNSNTLYEDPIVIFTFLTDDIDRTVLSFRGAQKPYYTLENGKLVLNGVPIEQSTAQFIKENPISIKSYLLAYLSHSRLIPQKIGSYLRGEKQALEAKQNLTRAIIQNTIDELRARNIRFFFIIFNSDWPDPIEGPATWRDNLAREIFDSNNVPYIWTKGLIQKDMENTGNNKSAYFLEGDGHYKDYTNGLVAEAIKEMMLKQRYESH